MSDASTTQPGERIYRQIGHLDSFQNNKISGPNGSEFLEINEDYKQRYYEEIDHNNILVIIWSFDQYTFRTVDTVKEILDAEAELIKNYELKYGTLPIGNVDDGSLFRRKAAPIKDVYESIFEASAI